GPTTPPRNPLFVSAPTTLSPNSTPYQPASFFPAAEHPPPPSYPGYPAPAGYGGGSLQPPRSRDPGYERYGDPRSLYERAPAPAAARPDFNPALYLAGQQPREAELQYGGRYERAQPGYERGFGSPAPSSFRPSSSAPSYTPPSHAHPGAPAQYGGPHSQRAPTSPFAKSYGSAPHFGAVGGAGSSWYPPSPGSGYSRGGYEEPHPHISL
ncbi:hypothetical protein TeGR_g4304, partial [Tetraparma gracilis]